MLQLAARAERPKLAGGRELTKLAETTHRKASQETNCEAPDNREI